MTYEGIPQPCLRCFDKNSWNRKELNSCGLKLTPFFVSSSLMEITTKMSEVYYTLLGGLASMIHLPMDTSV